MREAVELLLRGLDDVRVRMTYVQAADPAGEIDEGVAVDVRDRDATGLRDDNGKGHRERRGDAGREAVENLPRARSGNLGLQLDCTCGGHPVRA